MFTHETLADPDLDEVAFWRRFIAWWEAKEGRPATPRMLDALAYAQAREAGQDRFTGVDPCNKPKYAHEVAPEKTGEMSPPASGSTDVRTRH
jgi:hypothetical protein